MSRRWPTGGGLLASARSVRPRLDVAFLGLRRDVGWSVAHDLLSLVAAITSFLLLQQVLPPEAYGAYFGLYALIGILGALTYSGIGLSALQRLIGERRPADSVTGSTLVLTTVVGFGAAAVATVVAPPFLELPVAAIVTLVVAELLAGAIVWVTSVVMQGVADFPTATRIRMVMVGWRLTLVVMLYETSSLTIQNLGFGLLAGLTLYAIVLVFAYLPRQVEGFTAQAPSDGALRATAAFSIPMGASRIQGDADKFLLNAFRFGADAGLYGAAYRIMQLSTVPLEAVETAAFQRFLSREPDGTERQHLRRAIQFASLMFWAAASLAVGLLILLPLVDILLDDQYQEAADLVPWLVFLIPLMATSSVPLNALLGLDQRNARMWAYLVAASASLIAYLSLIPRYSWKGAVVGSYVGEATLAACGWIALWYFQRRADSTHDVARADALTEG